MKTLTWADVALGVWLIASPLLLGYGLSRGLLLAEDILPGIFLIATSCWILAKKRGSLEVNWLQGLSGLWLIIGSFALLFSRFPHAAVNALIVGILVLALELSRTLRLTKRIDAIV